MKAIERRISKLENQLAPGHVIAIMRGDDLLQVWPARGEPIAPGARVTIVKILRRGMVPAWMHF